MSKSIGGYGMPFALTMFKPELDIWSPGEHNGTFRGNQLSMVAAKAGLEYMLDHKVEAEVKRKEGIIRKYMDENIARPGVEIRESAVSGASRLQMESLLWQSVTSALKRD